MSNSISVNPLVLDTASTTAIVVNKPMNVRKVVWNSGASGVAGDSCIIKDKNGRVFLDITIDVAKQVNK